MNLSAYNINIESWVWYQLLVGLITGFCVSPINTIVDKAIIQHTNGHIYLWNGVWNGLKSFLYTPNKFFRTYQFLWIFLVYSLTYIASNYSGHFKLISGIDFTLNKLLLTSIVNSGVGMLKDRALAQALGGQKKIFPTISLIFFFLRDIIGMAAAFTIPPMLGNWISLQTRLSYDQCYTAAQLVSPILIQFIATPLHLIGLDIYNRPHQNLIGRYKYIKSIFTDTLLLRMIRFLPAYGIGGILNADLRESFENHYKNN